MSIKGVVLIFDKIIENHIRLQNILELEEFCG